MRGHSDYYLRTDGCDSRRVYISQWRGEGQLNITTNEPVVGGNHVNHQRTNKLARREASWRVRIVEMELNEREARRGKGNWQSCAWSDCVLEPERTFKLYYRHQILYWFRVNIPRARTPSPLSPRNQKALWLPRISANETTIPIHASVRCRQSSL